MKNLAPVALVTAALAIAGASASVAHDPKNDIVRLQQEIDQLRTEKNQLQDQNIELARRYDTDKRRMQIQLETAQKQIATLEADGGRGGAPASPLDEPIEALFDRLSLKDVADQLQEMTKVPFETQGVEGVKVRLRAGPLPGRTLLDLIVSNSTNAAGEWVAMKWTQGDDGTITIEPR